MHSRDINTRVRNEGLVLTIDQDIALAQVCALQWIAGAIADAVPLDQAVGVPLLGLAAAVGRVADTMDLLQTQAGE